MVDDDREGLADLIGPLWTVSRTSLELGITDELTAHGVLVVHTSDGHALVPSRQFRQEAGAPASIRPALAVFVETLALHDRWAVAVVMLGIPAPELDGRTPLAAAIDGDDTAIIEFAHLVRSEWTSGTSGSRELADALTGQRSYDDLDRSVQARVRAAWDTRIGERLSELDLSNDYGPNDAWPEADRHGELVWRHPAERDTPHDRPTPHITADLTTYGDASSFPIRLPRHLIGRLEPGDPVIISDDAVRPRAFQIVALRNHGKGAHVEEYISPRGVDAGGLSASDRAAFAAAGVSLEGHPDDPTGKRVIARTERSMQKFRATSLTVDDAAHLLGATTTHVTNMIATGQVFAFDDEDLGTRLPHWQFIRGAVLPGLAALHAVASCVNPFIMARFMEHPNVDLVIDGELVSPRVWLAAGRRPKMILDLASSLGWS